MTCRGQSHALQFKDIGLECAVFEKPIESTYIQCPSGGESGLHSSPLHTVESVIVC